MYDAYKIVYKATPSPLYPALLLLLLLRHSTQHAAILCPCTPHTLIRHRLASFLLSFLCLFLLFFIYLLNSGEATRVGLSGPLIFALRRRWHVPLARNFAMCVHLVCSSATRGLNPLTLGCATCQNFFPRVSFSRGPAPPKACQTYGFFHCRQCTCFLSI